MGFFYSVEKRERGEEHAFPLRGDKKEKRERDFSNSQGGKRKRGGTLSPLSFTVKGREGLSLEDSSYEERKGQPFVSGKRYSSLISCEETILL